MMLVQLKTLYFLKIFHCTNMLNIFMKHCWVFV